MIRAVSLCFWKTKAPSSPNLLVKLNPYPHFFSSIKSTSTYPSSSINNAPPPASESVLDLTTDTTIPNTSPTTLSQTSLPQFTIIPNPENTIQTPQKPSKQQNDYNAFSDEHSFEYPPHIVQIVQDALQRIPNLSADNPKEVLEVIKQLDIVYKYYKSNTPNHLDTIETALILALLGRAEIINKNFKKARQYFLKSSRIYEKLDPKSTQHCIVLEQLGLMAEKEKNAHDVVKYYSKAVKIREKTDPDRNIINMLYPLGECELRLSYFQDAKNHLIRAIAVYRKDLPVSKALATLLFLMGTAELKGSNPDWERGRRYLQESKHLFENFPEFTSSMEFVTVLQSLAETEKHFGNSKLSLSLIEESCQIIERNKPNSKQLNDMHCELGMLFHLEKNFHRSISYFKKALTFLNALPNANANLESINTVNIHQSKNYQHIGQFDKAIEHLSQALKLSIQHDPSSLQTAGINASLGTNELHRSQPINAKTYLHKSLSILKSHNPVPDFDQFLEPTIGLCRADYTLGNYETTVDHLKEFITRVQNHIESKKVPSDSPEAHRLWNLIAQLYHYIGTIQLENLDNPQDAIETLSKSLNLQTRPGVNLANLSSNLFKLALSYQANNNLPSASKYFSRTLSIIDTPQYIPAMSERIKNDDIQPSFTDFFVTPEIKTQNETEPKVEGQGGQGDLPTSTSTEDPQVCFVQQTNQLILKVLKPLIDIEKQLGNFIAAQNYTLRGLNIVQRDFPNSLEVAHFLHELADINYKLSNIPQAILNLQQEISIYDDKGIEKTDPIYVSATTLLSKAKEQISKLYQKTPSKTTPTT